MTRSVPVRIAWAARVLAIALAFFLGLFALDVFEAGKSTGEVAAGFAVHIVPSVLILAALGVAWQRERLGALIFLGLGLAAFWFFRGNAIGRWMTSAPLGVLALLFFLSVQKTKKTGSVG